MRTLRQRDDAAARDRLAQLAADKQAPEVLRAEAIVGVVADTPARRELLLALADRETARPAPRSAPFAPRSGADRRTSALGSRSRDAEAADAELVSLLVGQAGRAAASRSSRHRRLEQVVGKAGRRGGWRADLFPSARSRLLSLPLGRRSWRRDWSRSVDVARSLEPRRLLESLLDPGKEVAPQFSVWNISRTDGTTISGVLLSEQPDGSRQYGLVQGDVLSSRPEDVAETHAAKGSIMPENLLEQITSGEFVDLLTYLRTPK